jgi:hypothetical protein
MERNPTNEGDTMDGSTLALIVTLMLLCLGGMVCWMFYSIACRIVRMFAKTTRKTTQVVLAPYRRF